MMESESLSGWDSQLLRSNCVSRAPRPAPLIVSVMEVTSAATQCIVDLGDNDGEGRARQSSEQRCTAHAVRTVEVGPKFVPRLPGFVKRPSWPPFFPMQTPTDQVGC